MTKEQALQTIQTFLDKSSTHRWKEIQEAIDYLKTKTLEEAFLKLTGKEIREESGTAKDRMRVNNRMWGGR